MRKLAPTTLRFAAASAGAVVLLLPAGPPARAGAYEVRACAPESGAVFIAQANARGVAAWDACPGREMLGTTSGLIARALANGSGSRVPDRASAWQQVDAPPGARLEAMRFLASVGRYDGCFGFGVYAWNTGRFEEAGQAWGFPGNCSSSSTGLPWWYGPHVVALNGASHAAVGVRCEGPHGCETSTHTPAWANVRDVTVTVSDATTPSIEPAYGSLYAGGWHRGSEDAWSHYRDNVGIRRIVLRVDDTPHAAQDFADSVWPADVRCSWIRIRPCADITPGGLTLNTTAIGDGAHTIDLEAIDAADNVARRRHTIHVDNTPPASPAELGVDGGEGWRNANGFDVRWRLPSGQVSPIVRARWRLCRAGGTAQCQSGLTDGRGIERLANVRLPGAGDWTLAVWLEDAAGNADADRSRSVRLRLDDVAPRSGGFDAPDPADPRALSLPVADDLSGLAAATIELRRRGDGDWRPLPTGIGSGRALAHVPDEQLPDGAYEVRALVRDQAGNAVVVTVDRDGRPKTLALPLRTVTRFGGRATTRPLARRSCRRVRGRRRCTTKQPPTATVALGGGALSVAYGRTATLAARLETSEGRGVVGVPVIVTERLRGTTTWRALTSVVTGADGSVGHVAAAGPVRDLRLAFAGDPLLLPASTDVALRVPAAGSISVDRRRVRNGGRVRFRGRLLGGPIPSGGRRVALQAYFRGAWRTFATPRTTSAGRWTAAYRFGATHSRVTYRFRAVIYAEPSYPYDAGRTRVVRVTVTP